MINFNYEQIQLRGRTNWLSAAILSEGKKEEKSTTSSVMTNTYTKINLEYLKHDDLTDIISFDYTMGNEIQGIFYLCRTCSGKRSGFQSAF
jgi:ssRNA-specific RNase YbeY (16S rRNA maturation enzyme)